MKPMHKLPPYPARRPLTPSLSPSEGERVAEVPHTTLIGNFFWQPL